MNDELKCKYPYKVCHERRARKRNGSLHNLCSYHRQKANTIQKKHLSKRVKDMIPDPIPFHLCQSPPEDDTYLASLLLSLLDPPREEYTEPIELHMTDPTLVHCEIDVDTYNLLLNMTP
ncbi:hypothetical protein THRCLA_22149 [Thraustotheca clavata]|uniref:Uncharacterized protein n=1 Tax=Thraustotheca clavata TaxID=74557 RepID=A0A1V9ZBL7_9STRA|nr:hypothetical protein THRCLA_22149 [Thraustotheca clavata]